MTAPVRRTRAADHGRSGSGAPGSEPAPAVAVDEAAALMVSAFGCAPLTVTALPGERDRNFLVGGPQEHGTLVLKVLHPDEDPLLADFRSKALLHIGAVHPGLAVPKLCRPRGGGVAHRWEVPGQRPRLVQVMSYLPGRPLHGTPSTPAQRRSLGAFLARLDRALAAFRHPAETHDLIWDAHRAERVRGLLDVIDGAGRRAMATEALDLLVAAVGPRLPRLRQQVIHNDLNPQNVLVAPEDTDTVVGVIDFGDMVRAPLVQDLATTCAYLAAEEGDPLDVAADVAASFQSVEPLAPAELEVLPHLIAARLVVSATVSAMTASRQPQNAEYLLRNQPTVWRNLERVLEAL